MPAGQRKRFKRRTFAKLRIKKKKERSELIDTVDGNPIFTQDDIEDDRIIKLLQKRQNLNLDKDEKDIFLTDLLDFDDDENDDNDDDDDNKHQEMLKDIFNNSQQSIQATIMGSQLNDDAFHIQSNSSNLQYLLSKNNKNKLNNNDNNNNLSIQLDALDDNKINNERITMSDMIKNLNIPIAKSATKQITQFDDNQELEILKLNAQIKVDQLNLARKERGLQMDRTRKQLQDWSSSVAIKRDSLKHRRNMIPPRNNMISFMSSMEWNGNFGADLQEILDDYTKDNNLDDALKKHKPSRKEIITQSKKMANMRRQISNQIKEFRRIKKIKSKSFRKRIRARKSKINPSLEELREIDPKLYNREINKLIKKRAEERMTLKHKNTNKWSLRILRRSKNGNIDLNSRKLLMDQLQRGKELKRKIKGNDSDDDDNDDNDDDIIDVKSNHNDKTDSFETEKESAKKQKEKFTRDRQNQGIWSMDFMQKAENKRRQDIKSLTKQIDHARGFGDLDNLEREVDNISKSAYKINPHINAIDDPIAAKKYSNKMDKLKYNKSIQINKAQTILGKRKFGFSSITENIDDINKLEPKRKKIKKNKILNVGDNASLISNTQLIEESTFGIGTKSSMIIDIDNDNNDKLITKNTLKNKIIQQPVFEMIKFPKHNNKTTNISEINQSLSKNPLKSERNDKYNLNKLTKKAKIDVTVIDDDDNIQKDVKDDNNDDADGDGWTVLLDADQSVDAIHFGTFAPNQNVSKQNKKKLDDINTNDIDVNSFLDQDEDEDGDDGDDGVDGVMDVGNDNSINPIKSILKTGKFNSISTTNKHVKWNKNISNNNNDIPLNNPWLSDLDQTKKRKISLKNQNNQKETTIFDINNMLIPKKQRNQPDFNLLQSTDPQQIELIYNTLRTNNNNDNNAIFYPNDTSQQDFTKLKDGVISSSLGSGPEGALLGWDNWTGYGIVDDKAYLDDEYLEAKALWEKKKKAKIANRNDVNLSSVILSDQISSSSSKYLIKWQPDWFNPGMYRYKMDDTLGREWNLSTEFFHSTKPEYDIPSGYIINPTKKEDNKDHADMKYKTSFGNNNNQSKQKLYSIYKGNIDNNTNNNNKLNINNNDRPDRDKI